MAAEPEGEMATIYRDIARRVAAVLALRAREYSGKFPNIVIQNT